MRLRKGFTLIEIMLVIIIIGILAAMVIPNIVGRSDQARQTAAKSDIESNLANALDLYQLDNGHYPTTEQGLKILIAPPGTGVAASKWNGPYLKRKVIPKDPWGRDYVYVSPGEQNKTGYDLSSLGTDGIESQDDITNWGNNEN